MTVEPFIAIPIAIGVLVIGSCIFNVYRRRKVIRYSAVSREELEEKYQRELAKKDAKMQAEVEKRKAQEDNLTKGKPIWFSRYVENGRFKHWVLVIDDTKYELRRDDSNGRYTANVAPWTIDKEKREAAIAERKMPNVDGYYVCLIGWTRKEPQELAMICDEVMTQFGRYNIVWNNCQDFLKTFADRVISEKALDWSWFRDNTKTHYQETQLLKIMTPDEIIAANKAAAQNQLHAHLQHQNQHRIMHNINEMHVQINQQIILQNQINLQNQIQVQNQIQQNQINQQNQMQMQNQIQMQTMG
ncbi:hypothetical protein F4777DRAFT_158099 [Nemania sp. FL0916]|nr:hypothetical protein F4777DRAFT_158099 [Nemania sp. FL0916]